MVKAIHKATAQYLSTSGGFMSLYLARCSDVVHCPGTTTPRMLSMVYEMSGGWTVDWLMT